MENKKEYRKELIKQWKELEEEPLKAKEIPFGEPAEILPPSRVIPRGEYKEYQIIVEQGFEHFDQRDARISKIVVSVNKQEVLFVFAIASLEENYFNENKIGIHDIVLDYVEENIDRGLNKTPYFFELEKGKAQEVVDPEWWKGTKQHPLD